MTGGDDILDCFYLKLAKMIANNSTCHRRHVGAVIVKDHKIVGIGVNGAPEDTPSCDELGCLREKMNIPSGQRLDLCRAVHAEHNAIDSALKQGIDITEATIYVTDKPCRHCAWRIAATPISRVVYMGDYPDEYSLEILEMTGKSVYNLTEEVVYSGEFECVETK